MKILPFKTRHFSLLEKKKLIVNKNKNINHHPTVEKARKNKHTYRNHKDYPCQEK